MRSPRLRGKVAAETDWNGSRPVMSSRRDTRIAKQSESSPELLRARSSVSGGKVLFSSAATTRISSRRIDLMDMFVNTYSEAATQRHLNQRSQIKLDICKYH